MFFSVRLKPVCEASTYERGFKKVSTADPKLLLTHYISVILYLLMSKPLPLYLLSGTLESKEHLQVFVVTSVPRSWGRVPPPPPAHCFVSSNQNLFSRDLALTFSDR